MSSFRKTVLVIGATGYIGGHIITRLKQDSVEHTIFGLSTPGDPDANNKGWRSIEGSILDPDLKTLLEEIQPDEIYLANGLDRFASMKDQLEMYVQGTENLLKALVDTNIPARVVVIGSAAEYGPTSTPANEDILCQPESVYGICKLAQTLTAQFYAKQFNLPVIVARVFNAYGCSNKHLVVASLASQIANLEKKGLAYPRLKVRNLQSCRDLVHVRDIADALAMLADRGHPGEVYNIGGANALSIEDILQRIVSLSTIKSLDIIPVESESTSTHADFSEAVTDKIKHHTHWQPTVSLDQGFREEMDYWRREADFLALNAKL